MFEQCIERIFDSLNEEYVVYRTSFRQRDITSVVIIVVSFRSTIVIEYSLCAT